MKKAFNLIKFQERIIKGKSYRGQFKRCVRELMAQGFSDDEAVAIYHDALDMAELERIVARAV